MKTLGLNGVLTSCREDIRSMCKYGDGAYTISATRENSLIRLNEAQARDGIKIDKPVRPNDLSIRWVQSNAYELEGAASKVFNLRLTRSNLGSGSVNGDLMQYAPWEHALFSIRNRDTFPYGLSDLERSRIAFEKQAVVEQLLAITRANKLDRIAIKVPNLSGDPASILAKLSALKNSIKNIIFGYSGNSTVGGSSGRISRNVDMGLTEYLFVPSEF